MQQKRHEVLTWDEVDRLIDHLLPQFQGGYDAMVIITRGGIVPGGLLAEAMGITHILTAAVDFPAQIEMEKSRLLAWPQFLMFPPFSISHSFTVPSSLDDASSLESSRQLRAVTIDL